MNQDRKFFMAYNTNTKQFEKIYFSLSSVAQGHCTKASKNESLKQQDKQQDVLGCMEFVPF